MADPKFVRKFTGGPFKGLVFKKHDVPDRYDMIELEFAGGKKIVVTAQEYRDWPEANAGTIAPHKSALAMAVSYTPTVECIVIERFAEEWAAMAKRAMLAEG